MTDTAAAKPLWGTWHLAHWKIAYSDGRAPSFPFGPDATGLIQYTHDGGMAACIARAVRPKLSGESARSVPEAERLAAFESYFGAQENLDDPDVLVAVANSVGLDGDALRTRGQSDDVKALLRANTDEVIARGGYGSPMIFVDKTYMYFGNDQLPLVEFALNRSAG
jgi:2-hydroxychromene-2-carboxylate isomerase